MDTIIAKNNKSVEKQPFVFSGGVIDKGGQYAIGQIDCPDRKAAADALTLTRNGLPSQTMNSLLAAVNSANHQLNRMALDMHGPLTQVSPDVTTVAAACAAKSPSVKER